MNRRSLTATSIMVMACSGHHDPAPAKEPVGSNGSAASGSNGSNGGLMMHRTQAGTPDAHGWYPAHSEAGRFSVLMPAPFNDFSIDGLSEKGAAQVTDAIGTQLPDGVKFSAICNRGGDASPSDALKAMPKKMGLDPTLMSFKGHQALEMRSVDPVSLVRVIALKNQLCLLIVDPQGATKIVPDDKAQIMFESFTPDPVTY